MSRVMRLGRVPGLITLSVVAVTLPVPAFSVGPHAALEVRQFDVPETVELPYHFGAALGRNLVAHLRESSMFAGDSKGATNGLAKKEAKIAKKGL